MDSSKAKQLANSIAGKSLNGYKVAQLLGHGKSAAVFKGISSDGEPVAIKLFDHDLVDKFGEAMQIQRIEQEIALKGHCIPHLVGFLNGGKAPMDDQDYYYLVMDFIDGTNLATFIREQDYDRAFIDTVLAALYTVSEALLDKGIAHRDIKPANIMVTSSRDIVLMDLGVHKLIGAPAFTDVGEEKEFLGTKRYSPPEFLRRKEKDCIDGWRAVNLYQIGGVLHDLITKTVLFADKTPFTNLVLAAIQDNPPISNPNMPTALNQLTRDLLAKDPDKRLRVHRLGQIDTYLATVDAPVSDLASAIAAVNAQTDQYQDILAEIDGLKRTVKETNELRDNITCEIAACVKKGILRLSKNPDVRYGIDISSSFLFPSDHDKNDSNTINFLVTVSQNLALGLPWRLCIVIRTTNNENHFTTVELLGFIPTGRIKIIPFHDSLPVFQQLDDEQIPGHERVRRARMPRGAQYPIFDFPFFTVFDGTIETNDAFSEDIAQYAIKMIHNVVLQMRDATAKALAIEKFNAQGGDMHQSMPEPSRTRYFSSFD